MPAIKGDFYAMSIFYYTLDCVRHIGPIELEHWPRPTIAELEHAVDKFCGLHWDKHFDKEHNFTSKKRMPYRCVEVFIHIYVQINIYI